MTKLPTSQEIDEEIQDERIRQLEHAVAGLRAEVTALQDNFLDVHTAIAEMQRMMVKVAASQQQVIDRVRNWPFVRVGDSED